MPPSDTQALIARCFHARNGELGIRLEDVDAFLDLCTAKGHDAARFSLSPVRERVALAPARVGRGAVLMQ